MAGHALVGCVSAVASRGKCGAGALSGAAGSFAGPFLVGLDFAGKLVARSVIGGLASVAGGGKFENGAVTAAFGYHFSAALRGAESANGLQFKGYARTFIDFWGNIVVEYGDRYDAMDPISKISVVIHEQVHVEQLTAVLANSSCSWFWGLWCGLHRRLASRRSASIQKAA
jgi:hypothetical protein